MKTRTISRFEKDLRNNGFEYKVVKELRDITRYDITKDGVTERYETWNILDRPVNAYKLFITHWDLTREYERRVKEQNERTDN